MIVWGKLIDCLIDADVNYLNGELFNSQFRVKGKFLVFGNLYTLEKTTPGGEAIQVCVPIDATFMAYYQGMVAVSEGGGLFDCYYGDVIDVEKLKGVGAIVVKEEDTPPVRTMKTLVAKWYNKKLLEEEKAYEVCNTFVT